MLKVLKLKHLNINIFLDLFRLVTILLKTVQDLSHYRIITAHLKLYIDFKNILPESFRKHRSK